jgi:hypothetical protein
MTYHKYILSAQCQRCCKRLPRPLVRWINSFPGEVLGFGVEDPSYAAVVDRHADKRAKYLGEEDCSRRDVHVVTDSVEFVVSSSLVNLKCRS